MDLSLNTNILFIALNAYLMGESPRNSWGFWCNAIALAINLAIVCAIIYLSGM